MWENIKCLFWVSSLLCYLQHVFSLNLEFSRAYCAVSHSVWSLSSMSSSDPPFTRITGIQPHLQFLHREWRLKSYPHSYLSYHITSWDIPSAPRIILITNYAIIIILFRSLITLQYVYFVFCSRFPLCRFIVFLLCVCALVLGCMHIRQT